jgi:hypothetical protein
MLSRILDNIGLEQRVGANGGLYRSRSGDGEYERVKPLRRENLDMLLVSALSAIVYCFCGMLLKLWYVDLLGVFLGNE